MPFYEKGDIRIHYEETGSGFPLLLIPGGGLNSNISFLTGFAHPIRFNAMVAAGKIPDSMLANLPPAAAYKGIKFASADQADKAKKVIAEAWPRLVKV